MSAAELTGLEGVYEQGTNLHHALALAGRHLRRHPNAQPVVLVVTDGEPTAHLEAFGRHDEPASFFDYPPHPRTIAHTVRGFDDMARLGAQVTIFRLGNDPGLARFIDQVARRVQGRVVVPDLDGLGAAVVGDYLRSRRRNAARPRLRVGLLAVHAPEPIWPTAKSPGLRHAVRLARPCLLRCGQTRPLRRRRARRR